MKAMGKRRPTPDNSRRSPRWRAPIDEVFVSRLLRRAEVRRPVQGRAARDRQPLPGLRRGAPGERSSAPAGLPRVRAGDDHRATQERQTLGHRRPLCRNEGTGGRVLHHRCTRPERGDPRRLEASGRALGRSRRMGHRGPTHRERGAEGDAGMRFMIMVRANRDTEAGVLPEDDELMAAMASYHEELAKAGALLDASGLQPSSKGWRIRYSGTRRQVIDGPFAETKELIAG